MALPRQMRATQYSLVDGVRNWQRRKPTTHICRSRTDDAWLVQWICTSIRNVMVQEARTRHATAPMAWAVAAGRETGNGLEGSKWGEMYWEGWKGYGGETEERMDGDTLPPIANRDYVDMVRTTRVMQSKTWPSWLQVQASPTNLR